MPYVFHDPGIWYLVSVSCIILYFVSMLWPLEICSSLNFRSHFSEYFSKVFRFCEITFSSFLDLIICHRFKSSAIILTLLVISSGMSFTYKRYNKGPNTEPWGTQFLTVLHDDLEPSTITLIFLSLNKSFIQCPVEPDTPYHCNFVMRRWFGTVSKAFDNLSRGRQSHSHLHNHIIKDLVMLSNLPTFPKGC